MFRLNYILDSSDFGHAAAVSVTTATPTINTDDMVNIRALSAIPLNYWAANGFVNVFVRAAGS